MVGTDRAPQSSWLSIFTAVQLDKHLSYLYSFLKYGAVSCFSLLHINFCCLVPQSLGPARYLIASRLLVDLDESTILPDNFPIDGNGVYVLRRCMKDHRPDMIHNRHRINIIIAKTHQVCLLPGTMEPINDSICITFVPPKIAIHSTPAVSCELVHQLHDRSQDLVVSEAPASFGPWNHYTELK